MTLQTEQDLVSNATAAYLTILRREQLLTVAESDLAVSQERRRVAEVRFVGGAAARSDVLRADSNFGGSAAASRAGGQRCGDSQKQLECVDGTLAGNAV